MIDVTTQIWFRAMIFGIKFLWPPVIICWVVPLTYNQSTHTIIFVKVASKEDFDVTLNFHKFFINLNELFNLKTNWKSE